MSARYFKTREEWLEARRAGIGGSDAAAILGYDPYRTPLDVWREKMGTATPRAETPHMQRGNALEPLVIDMVRAMPDVFDVRTPGLSAGCTHWLIAHPKYPALLASPDAFFATRGVRAGRLDVLEVKCPSAAAFRQWQRDGLPPQYLIQMQHYLMVGGSPRGQFAIFCADSWTLWMVEVERDETLIAQMDAILPRWYADHVLTGIEPPMNESLPPLPGSYSMVKLDDPKIISAARMALQGKESLRLAEEFADATKEDLIALLPEHTEAAVTYTCGDVRVKREYVKGRTTLDAKAVKGMSMTYTNVALTMLKGYEPKELTPVILEAILGTDAAVRFEDFEKTGKPSERITIESVIPRST